jgi:hypothetical protein
VAVGEVDVFFVEDGSPLEGCGWDGLVLEELRQVGAYRAGSGRLCNGRACCREAPSD